MLLTTSISSVINIAAKCNQGFENITLVAVSKTVPTEKINQAIEAGITDIGENKVQEAKIKKDKVNRLLDFCKEQGIIMRQFEFRFYEFPQLDN